MRTLSLTTILLIVLSGSARNGYSQKAPTEAPPGTSHVIITLAHTYNSIEKLYDTSDFVVQAHVNGIIQVRDIQPPRSSLVTDFSVSVTNVIKGSDDINNILISQIGGTLNGREMLPDQYVLLLPGEDCILFLVSDPAKPVAPQTAARYRINGEWNGAFHIHNNIVTTSPSTDRRLKDRYENQSPQRLLTDIAALKAPK